MSISNFIDGVECRGNVFYLRWRVPAEFRTVETRAEINQSLKLAIPARHRVAPLSIRRHCKRSGRRSC